MLDTFDISWSLLLLVEGRFELKLLSCTAGSADIVELCETESRLPNGLLVEMAPSMIVSDSGEVIFWLGTKTGAVLVDDEASGPGDGLGSLSEEATEIGLSTVAMVVFSCLCEFDFFVLKKALSSEDRHAPPGLLMSVAATEPFSLLTSTASA